MQRDHDWVEAALCVRDMAWFSYEHRAFLKRYSNMGERIGDWVIVEFSARSDPDHGSIKGSRNGIFAESYAMSGRFN